MATPFSNLMLIVPKLFRRREDPGYQLKVIENTNQLFIIGEIGKFVPRTGICMDLMPLAKVTKIYSDMGEIGTDEFSPYVTFAGTAVVRVKGREEKIMVFQVPKEMQPDDLDDSKKLYFGYILLEANKDTFFKSTTLGKETKFKPIFEGYYD